MMVLSKIESVKIYWLSVKFDWFKYLKRVYCKSVKLHWLFQWKLTDLTVKNIFFTDESVKGQITDSISENLTDSDLESHKVLYECCVTGNNVFCYIWITKTLSSGCFHQFCKIVKRVTPLCDSTETVKGLSITFL